MSNKWGVVFARLKMKNIDVATKYAQERYRVKINEQIAYLRRKKGMTQEQLAAALGVTNQSVSKWESGQNCPDIQLLPELARIFDVTIDSLMGCQAKDSLSELMLKVRRHLADTSAGMVFESCYKLAALLHEAALTYGYSIDARWSTQRDYAREDMDKWGLSLMNDPDAGCSGRNSRGIFFALASGDSVPDAYQTRKIAEQLRKFADSDTLMVMFALAGHSGDSCMTVHEMAEQTGMAADAVERALYAVQAERMGDGYRLDERLRHIPALVSFFAPA